MVNGHFFSSSCAEEEKSRRGVLGDASRPLCGRRAQAARRVLFAAAACAVCLLGLVFMQHAGSPSALFQAQKLSYGVRMRGISPTFSQPSVI